MLRLLTLNLDFVLILQAGLLLVLATANWGRTRREDSQPWYWVGWYAFLQACQTGLDLAVYENSVPPLLHFLDDALNIGSALVLIEFARTRFFQKTGPWIHLLPIGCLGVALLTNGDAIPIWAVVALAIFGAACGASAFWRMSPVPGIATGSHPLRLAALTLIACQLITALPDQHLEATVFDLPPIALRCALFFILTLAILNHQFSEDPTSRLAAQSSARSRRRFFCGTVIVLLGIAGWGGADLVGHNQDQSMRQQILARTKIAAATVLAGDVSALHWNESDLTNPAYVKLKALMMSMRQANADLRFVLLAGLREQKAYFLVDSEKPESEDYSPPGQSYDEATTDYLAGLAAGRPFVLGPETDRWGTWVFGDAPVVDARGHTLAYLELDIAAADWEALIRHARLPVLLITLLIVALVLGSFQALERLRDTSAEISLSEQRNRSLVEGSPDCVQMFDLAGRYVAVN